MAEFTAPKLNPESHVQLDHPLLRVPYELSRKNFKTSQRIIEREREATLNALSGITSAITNPTLASADSNASASATIETLDSLIARAENLQRKLESLHAEEQSLHRQTRARISHLGALYSMQSLTDVSYERWSKTRLSRLLVDYLLRSGYGESAKALAKEDGVEDLVDVEAFVTCHRVEESLSKGRTATQALNWCADNKLALRRMNNSLEYELRLQQFIELVRTGRPEKLLEARAHARKHLTAQADTEQTIKAAGLLAFSPHTKQEPYRTMFSAERWDTLSALFLKTHHELLGLPATPHLHVALSAGLSALKTPACHSKHISPSANANATVPSATDAPGVSPSLTTSQLGTSQANSQQTVAAPTTPAAAIASNTSVCPICSTELNALARSVPFAHHSKSIVEHDPVVLPNGRIYGRERLERWNEKMGLPPGCGRVRDPSDASIEYREDEIRKVYIS